MRTGGTDGLFDAEDPGVRYAPVNLLVPKRRRGAGDELRIITRAYTHFTDYGPFKPNVGGIIHNTVGNTPVTTAQSAGSWHYLIDRDREGTIYRDVPLSLGAWHARATDRWRPSWMQRAPGGRTSDPNYCTVGIEMVSLMGGAVPAGYIPYTDSQYAALKRLLRYLTLTVGNIPWIGHGEIQRDRTDPVGFDWKRAGFGPMIDGWGRLFIGDEPGVAEEVPMDTTPQERAKMKPEFEIAGVSVNMETALMKRAALAYKRSEWRGPAVSGEYPATSPSGKEVVRQNFSAGVLEWQPDTGECLWVEVVAHGF